MIARRPFWRRLWVWCGCRWSPQDHGDDSGGSTCACHSPSTPLWRDEEGLTIRPARFLLSIRDGLVVLLAIPVFELIDAGQAAHWLRVSPDRPEGGQAGRTVVRSASHPEGKVVMRYLIGLTAGLLILASCDRPDATGAAPSASAPPFSHAFSSDLSGYYRPVTEVRIGDWSFDHVFVGQTAEFQAWEAGGRNETFGPVMLQFDDVASPVVATGAGEAHSVTARVLPTAYAVTDTSISFEGRSPELGAVSFEGVLDPGALATARRNLGAEGVVVTGELKVGQAPPRTVRLRWWGGD